MKSNVQSLDILIQVNEKLFLSNTIIGIAIKGAIAENKPASEIFKTILEMYSDNQLLIENIFGKELIDEILNFNSIVQNNPLK